MLFFVMVFGFYGLSHWYLLRRLSRALAGTGALRIAALALVIALASSFILVRVLFGSRHNPWSDGATIAGFLYLALYAVSLQLFLAYDLIRLLDRGLRFLPESVRADSRAGGRAAIPALLGAAVLICLAGAWNASRIHVRTLTLDIPKEAGGRTELRIAVASDLHLSPVLKSGFVDRVFARLAAFEPDLVLLPGDIVGEDTPPDARTHLAEAVAALGAPLGVFACVGNHEYYGGLEESLAILRAAGIRVLLDEAVPVGESLFILGRRDRTALRMGGTREPLAEIMSGLDFSKPVIVMDHQPLDLDEAVAAGADLLLCGHTHNGQMFPINVINRFVYEVNHGHVQRNRTHIDVSSGAGTWGPPVRIGSTSEVVHITLRFRPSR